MYVSQSCRPHRSSQYRAITSKDIPHMRFLPALVNLGNPMPIQIPFHFLTYPFVSAPFVSSFAVFPSDRMQIPRIWWPSS